MLVLRTAPIIHVSTTTETETEMIIALNIMFATFVIVGIVGMLAWSIDSQKLDPATRQAPSARRRRRANARARVVGRTVETRA
jgi:hypothetical protein